MADEETDLGSAGGRLKWAREKAGFREAAQFARAARINETTYRAYENNQNSYRKHVLDFAARLNVSVGWLLKGGALEEPEPQVESPFVEIIAAVGAGVWRERAQWPEEDRYRVEFGPPALRGFRRFGLVVEGTSMDKIFPPGTELECYWTKFEGRQILSPQDGDLVVVERRNGDLYETTCKRLVITPEGEFELHAESTRPEFKEPFLIGRPDVDHHIDVETEIIGIVDRAVQRHFRRARRLA